MIDVHDEGLRFDVDQNISSLISSKSMSALVAMGSIIIFESFHGFRLGLQAPSGHLYRIF